MVRCDYADTRSAETDNRHNSIFLLRIELISIVKSDLFFLWDYNKRTNVFTLRAAIAESRMAVRNVAGREPV